MSNKFQNPNLVIKNGAFLLFRMLLVLFLGFFATRLTLQVLGDEKFGIYNIVGGIVAIFAIISMPIRDSLQRFFNVEFANGKYAPDVVFNTSVRIIRLMILVITILYETIGLCLINFVIKYPVEETVTVNVIFQICALANIFGFAELPYVSLLFSHENMGIPAFCEIGKSVLKIILLYLIPFIPIDILIPYACIFLLLNIFVYSFYKVYCKKRYRECFVGLLDDKTLRKNMLTFSGWSFVESVSGVAITYVSNVFINVFGGVLYNTAYGVSKQLQAAVISFSSNVLKASEPQITSNTAGNNDVYRNQLVITTSKISFLCVAFIYIIFHFDGTFLLDIWLDKVPEYAVEFCEISLLAIVFTSISLPYRTLIMATGVVKGYFSTYGIVSLVSMAVMFFLLKMGVAPISAMYIIMTESMVMWIVAIYFSTKLTTIEIWRILKEFLLQMMALLGSYFCYYLIKVNSTGVGGVFGAIMISAMVLCVLTYCIAFNQSEKGKFRQLVCKFLSAITKSKINKK